MVEQNSVRRAQRASSLGCCSAPPRGGRSVTARLKCRASFASGVDGAGATAFWDVLRVRPNVEDCRQIRCRVHRPAKAGWLWTSASSTCCKPQLWALGCWRGFHQGWGCSTRDSTPNRVGHKQRSERLHLRLARLQGRGTDAHPQPDYKRRRRCQLARAGRGPARTYGG
jgi:hypothetical protein